MVHRITAAAVFFLCIIIFSLIAHAKLPPKIEDALLKDYAPAEDHKGLVSAQVDPLPAKLHSFVVVEKGGIPAERAHYFIGWDDYDYRGVTVDLMRDERVDTRRGPIYTYLQRGDVMAVAAIKDFGNAIYLKLISADVYVPTSREKDKRHSRVTVMLGFKFPKQVFKEDNAEEVLKKIGDWLKPFSNVNEAKVYAAAIKLTQEGVSNYNKEKAAKSDKVREAVPSALQENEADERIDSLEKKIGEAKRQMEEAEKEMQRIRENQKGSR